MARRGAAGSVTAETAVALPAVVVAALAVIAVGQVAVAQVRCVDAARAGVRLVARREPSAAALARAASIAPPGASVSAAAAGNLASVAVRAEVGLPLGLHVAVGSTAVADLEPQGEEVP